MRVLSTVCLSLAALSAHGGQVNYLGDTPAAGSSVVNFSNQYTEWQTSGDHISNSSALDDDDRVSSTVRGHGHRWMHELTYLYGVDETWSVGASQGYGESRWHVSQTDLALNSSEGAYESAGETDLSLLVNYSLAKGTAASFDLTLPTAGANQAQPNRWGVTDKQGDQGSGYTTLNSQLAANWVTELGTRWMGAVNLDITTREKVNGHGVSGPWSFGLKFGGLVELKKDHELIAIWCLDRGMPYKSYSGAQQKEVSYGDQSRFGLDTQYQWNITESLQLQSYLNLAMVQHPIHKYSQGGEKQRVELSGGTETQIGLALKLEI